MSTIDVTEENIMKAHENGCEDVKRVLETLFPALFKEKEWEKVPKNEIVFRDGYLYDTKECFYIVRIKNLSKEILDTVGEKAVISVEICSGITRLDYKLQDGVFYRRQRS